MTIASQAGTTRTSFHIALRDVLVWLAFFLVIVGVRLLLVANYGSAMPILDQWDDEGARTFKPWLEGTFAPADVFAPHNEHRPAIARVLALALLIFNGQWDARVQMVVNSVVAGVLAVMIASLGLRLVDREHRTLVLAAVASWSCLPFGWENTTWAFQSSFYFLLLFSASGIWRLISCSPLTKGWWLGAAAASLACLTMASGFLAAAAVLVVVALRWRRGRTSARAGIETVLVCAALIVAGVALCTRVAGHDVYRATSVVQWLDVIGRCLAWPFTQHSAATLFTYLPVGLLAVLYFSRKRIDLTHASAARIETILGIGLWVAMQSAAIGYARGGGLAAFMPPRYMDVLALGVLANFFALFAAAQELQSTAKRVVHFAGAVWAAILFAGVLFMSYDASAHLTARAGQIREAETRVRAYVASGDFAQLADGPAEAAYPWTDRLASLLDDPTIRRILAPTIRRPLQLKPEGSAGPFVAQPRAVGERIWSSESADGKTDTAGEMRTQLIQPSLPYLWLEMRGALRDGMSLKLRDERSGDEDGVPFARNPNGWRSGYARVRGDLRLVARDDATGRSLVFTEPREVGRLSYYAERVLNQSLYVCLSGLAIAVGLVAHGALQRSGSSAARLDF